MFVILQMVTSNAGNPQHRSAVELSACSDSRGDNSNRDNTVIIELPITDYGYLNINEMYKLTMSGS